MSHPSESYNAHIYVTRSKWDEVHGADFASEFVTSESTDGHSSIISLLSKVERIAGRKLILRAIPDDANVGTDNWIEGGYIYDIAVTFFRSLPFDMSSYLESED